MSYTSTNPGLLTGDWLAESARVTLFSREVKPTDLLAKLVGKAPELVNERPNQNIRQESTAYKSGQLIVTSQPGRLDLIYGPRPPSNMFEASSSSPLVYVSELSAALDEINDLGFKLCGLFPDVLKVALCPVAIKQAETGTKAASLLVNCFPGLPIKDQIDSEIVWQVNRRSRAKSFNCNLNNIYKLHSITTSLISLIVQNQSPVVPQAIVSVSFARFELEVNTDTEPEAGTSAAKIFEELSMTVKHALTRPGL